MREILILLVFLSLITFAIWQGLYILSNAPQCIFANDSFSCVEIVKLRKIK